MTIVIMQQVHKVLDCHGRVMNCNIIVSYAIVFVFGIILGFFSAIPIGAVQLQVIKKAMQGFRKPAIMIALGSGTSDMVYGILTLFGLGGVLMSDRFQLVFYLLGAAVLSFLLYRSLQEHRGHTKAVEGGAVAKKNNQACGFMTGLTLAITNPSIALWWIVGFKVFLDLGFFTEATFTLRLVFVVSGVTGLVGYLIILSLIIHRIHRAIPERIFSAMNRVLTVLYIILIAYFIYKAAGYMGF